MEHIDEAGPSGLSSSPKRSGKAVPGNSTFAFCKSCNVQLRCGVYYFKQHAQTKMHECSIRRLIPDKLENITDVVAECKKLELDEKIKIAEIKLSAFYAEHNIAIQTVDHLIPLLKDIFQDQEIVERFTLGRTKCTEIIKNNLGTRETERTVQILQNQYFSILMDESTDKTNSKSLCILVQYISPETGKLITELLKLLEIDAKDSSAGKLYDAFKNCLDLFKIPFNNIIGFASDNASVMIGARDSFLTRLKDSVPRVILINCICHTSAIIAKKCSKELPSDCEFLIRSVATFISSSPKRSAILQDFQEYCNVETRKLIKLSGTRWLTTQKCVCRLLENWNPLKLFFQDAWLDAKIESAEKILLCLNEELKSYFFFLNYALTIFNKFNATFQGRETLINKYAVISVSFMRQFAQNCIKPEHLDNISELDYSDSEIYLPITDVFFGSECKKLFQTLPSEKSENIQINCFNFYKVALREMHQRLPIKDSFFSKLNFISPDVALDQRIRINKITDLNPVLTCLPNVFQQNEVDLEWCNLPLLDHDIKEKLKKLNAVDFWHKVGLITDFNDTAMFPNLKKIANMVLSLPHSNAEAERIFSIVTDVRTNKRNAISSDLLNAICKIRSSFQAHNKTCLTFKVDSRHLELHNSEILY
ncbi:SCAN domain-containing protein 3-like [Prorops nasuta]|uniref:SCAN domain-containing protein 3-like n=1 Tax=Prorops nasuta TaxID=863751 RepID=UPI0034CE0D46